MRYLMQAKYQILEHPGGYWAVEILQHGFQISETLYCLLKLSFQRSDLQSSIEGRAQAELNRHMRNQRLRRSDR